MDMTTPTWVSQIACRCALPLVSVATDSRFWPLYRELHRRHTEMGVSPSSAETLERLRALVGHAYETVPMHRERLQATGVTPDCIRDLDAFRAIPSLGKTELAANFPDRAVSSKRDHLPWRYTATSGTIDRLTVVHDLRKRDFARSTQLLGLRATVGFRPGMKYLEIPPDACAHVCGIEGMTSDPPLVPYLLRSAMKRSLLHPETLSNVRGLFERQVVYRRLELPSLSRDGLVQKDEVLDRYLEQIDQYRPHVVKALPIYLYVLARRLERSGARPPRISGGLMPMGSSITPFMKRIVESAFERPMYEDYGSAELSGIAAECSARAGLHPFEEVMFVEVERNGRPARVGELGRVLVTDLWNYAMPLIRYDIGDVAVVQEGRCACGRTTGRLDVRGRLHDCLVADDGTVRSSDEVIDSVLEATGVLGFQLDERPEGEVHLRVVSNRPGSVDDAADVVRQLLGNRRRVVVRPVSTILPERSGKYRLIRNLTAVPSQVISGRPGSTC